MLKDSPERYGALTRFFHWLTAILLFQQFFKFADRINEGEHWLGDTFGKYHGSIGLILLIIIALRILWTAKQRHSQPLNYGIQGVAAKIVHRLMYAAVFALPLLGVLYVYGLGYSIRFFGNVIIQAPSEEIAWAIALGKLHSPVAILLAALVIGHIGAALYHQFVDKSDVLKRMV